MSTITISVEEETERKFRAEVKEHLGKGKGVLGKAITEAMRLWIEEKTQQDIAKELKQMMQKGHTMGRILYTKREELYGRS